MRTRVGTDLEKWTFLSTFSVDVDGNKCLEGIELHIFFTFTCAQRLVKKNYLITQPKINFFFKIIHLIFLTEGRV